MSLLYVDALSGVSGDMFLGALLDAGLSEADLRRALESLAIGGYDLEVRRKTRGGLAATRAEVRLDPAAEQPHRHLHHIEKIIEDGRLPGASAERAKAVFRRLAEAEAKVHGTAIEKVHFHEVGAVDAIVDVVGVCAGLAILGVNRIVASPLPMGSGYVDAAHGRLPVPAPAVVEIMKGFPTRSCDEPGELTTPTGAALVVTLADAFGPMPPMVTEAVGYGAGAREGVCGPNVLRVMLGGTVGSDEAAESDTVWVLEANLDDATGESLGAATQAIFETGALDVWLTPATMKKGRSGVVLACLVAEGLVGAVEDAIFRETTTFGVRRAAVQRAKLAREHVTVKTPYGMVRIKVGRRGGKVVTASPEYEDVRRQAEECGKAFREVYVAAVAAYREVESDGSTR